MTSLNRLFLPLLVLAMLGCASYPVQSTDYIFSYEDKSNERQILLTIQNTSDRELCVENDGWPIDASKYLGAGRRVTLNVDGEAYHYKDYDNEYCTSSACFTSIPPDSKLNGVLLYKDFDMPNSAYFGEKELSMIIPVGSCD